MLASVQLGFSLDTCAMDWLFRLGLRLTLENSPSDHSTLTNFLSFTVSDEHARMHPDIPSARPSRWLELATSASIGSGKIYSRRPRIWHQANNPLLMQERFLYVAYLELEIGKQSKALAIRSDRNWVPCHDSS